MGILKFFKWLLGIVVALILIFESCKVAEELSISRQSKTERIAQIENLKINGYYYVPYQTGYTGFFIYEDGKYLSFGALLNTKSLEELDNKLLKLPQKSFNAYWFWGIYKIQNNRILINRWLPGTGGPYPEQLLEGRLLNKEIIVIAGLTENGTENRIDTFRFREFSPKPDSINKFIKQ